METKTNMNHIIHKLLENLTLVGCMVEEKGANETIL